MRAGPFRGLPALLLALALLGGQGWAENYDHPGLVFAGKEGWVTPEQATAKGYTRYRGRWLHRSMSAKLKTWEAQDAKVKGWGDAWKTESANYRILTTVPRFIVELEIIPFLDALYATYVRVFKEEFGVSGKGANKKTIKVHHGYAEYALAEAEDGQPLPRENPGFILGGDELIVYYDDLDPAEFYATVFHEGTHQFVVGLFPAAKLPMWLDEGLAVWFEGCTYSRASKQVKIGHFPPDRVEEAQDALKGVEPRPGENLAKRLFIDVPDADFGSTQYALAWSFLHYLIEAESGRHREAFSRFLHEMNGAGERPVAEVFERATRLKLEDVQQGWYAHVQAMKKPIEPTWVTLVTEDDVGPDPGIHEGDRLVSYEGVEVTTCDGFQALWKQRPPDRPIELVVLRRTAVAGFVEWRDEQVTLAIPPSVIRAVRGVEGAVRLFNLRD